ncbi:MAG: eIF2A-related protein [Coleofasciculus sp.]|uniref:WD40 domain-containing protein n=2 Tax=Coleofasciculus sp. TaxID=3100458 RepID=UPI003A3AB3CE
MTNDNEQSLKTLIRAIQLSQGEFSLILARCNYFTWQKQITQQLQEQCSIHIKTIILQPSVTRLYSTIIEHISSSNSAVQSPEVFKKSGISPGTEKQSPNALVVFGLDSITHLDQLLTATNQIREEFRKLPFPLILWVTDNLLRKLIRLVPDFESWATQVEFAIATQDLIDRIQQTADTIFTEVLNAGAGRFLDNAVFTIAVGSRRRSELESALNDLHRRGEPLTPDVEAKLHFLLGRDAQANNQMEKASQYYQQSLAFWQQSDYPEQQGCLLFYLGLWWRCYAVLHRADYWRSCYRAKDYFQRCVRVFQQGNRPDLAARFINPLGEVLIRLQEWQELEEVAKTAVHLHQTYLDSTHLYAGYADALLAEVALARGAWSDAKRYAEFARQKNNQQSVVDLASQHDHTHWAWAWQHYQSLYLFLLAKAQRHLDQTAEAIQNLETAKNQSLPDYDPQLYIDILKELRGLYFERDDYLKSFALKLEQRSIEAQYGFRPFVGAGRLKSIKRVINSSIDSIYPQVRTQDRITASGRGQDIQVLRTRLSEPCHKLTVMHGQSGVGKSSLLSAGLVPDLKQHPVGDRYALPVTIRVYTNWVNELGIKLAEALTERGIEALDLSDESHSFSRKAGESVKRLDGILETLRKNGDRHLLTVLIFDQFEEFFFHCSHISTRREFYQFLECCLSIPYLKIIVALREDYLHYLLEFERLANLEEFHQNILDKTIRYYLGDFSPERAKSVIQDLTERSQFYLEPALIDEVVQDLASDVGKVRPIELQVVGAQLQTYNITKLHQYRQLLNHPKETLAQRFLEEVVVDCGANNQQLARLILYLLTYENGTRPLKTRAELEADLDAWGFPVGIQQLNLVLHILVGSGIVFLVPDYPVNRYQLFHDYLVDFIRQKQAPGLLAELAEAKEKQKLTEAQLRQALKEKEEALTHEQQARRRTEIAEIETLSSLAQAMFLCHDQLGALVTSVKAGQKLKYINAPATIKTRTLCTIWQVIYSMKECNRFQGHSGGVWSVSFSPDGQTLASASTDGTVKLWRLDGTILQTFEGHRGMVRSVSFSPDGQTLASASTDGTVKLWRLNGAILQTFEGHSDWVRSVSFSPDSQIIASASGDGTVKLWGINGKLIRTLKGHSDWVNSVTFSPDGQLIASTSHDRTVKLWRLDGTVIQTFAKHKGGINSISFSPDGQMIASASHDRTVKLWRLDGTTVQTFQEHSDGVYSVTFSPDGQIITSASSDGTVKLWRLDGTIVQTFQGYSSWLWSISFSPDNRTLASASTDGTVKLWRTNSTVVQTFHDHSDGVNSVSFSPDGQRIASASGDGTVKLRHLDDTDVQTFAGHRDWVSSISFSPDGQMLASASHDGTVKLWGLDGTVVQTFRGHSGLVKSVSFSPDGQTIASASTDCTVQLWRLDGKVMHIFPGHSGGVNSVSFSPNGQTLVSASRDGTMKLWRTDGAIVQDFERQGNWVNSVSFSPNGQIIASANGDGTVKLWGLDGALIQTFQGHGNWVNSVSFSPDGQTIASASGDGTVKFWRIDGTELQTFQGHGNWVYSVSFSPDGQTIASASRDGTVKVMTWKLALDDLLRQGCNWLRDYLKTNPNVSESDRNLCDDISCQ